MRIALVSCKKLPEPDPDEPLLLAALAGAGADARVLAWDDDDAPFAEQDLTVLRSSWNYYQHVDEFVAWTERTARVTRLHNPPAIIAANAKKTYLAELEARGVDVVPTEFVKVGEKRAVASLVEARGWEHVVIKPVVSAASYRTKRFDRASVAAAQAFLDDLVRDRDAMVQQWMPSVETYGERALVWIDGELTHAIRKSPRLAGGDEEVSDEVPIAPDERAFAERVLAPLASQLLYARVDVVRDPDDRIRVMELELIEPSLFLAQCRRALDRFVAAVTRRARSA